MKEVPSVHDPRGVENGVSLDVSIFGGISPPLTLRPSSPRTGLLFRLLQVVVSVDSGFEH